MRARTLVCSTMDTLHTQLGCAREEPYTEPVPLTGRKLALAWIALFSLGWAVVLGLFGVLYWVFQ